MFVVFRTGAGRLRRMDVILATPAQLPYALIGWIGAPMAGAGVTPDRLLAGEACMACLGVGACLGLLGACLGLPGPPIGWSLAATGLG